MIIQIPCYNEAGTLAIALAALPKVNKYKYESVRLPSLDRTDSTLVSVEAEPNLARESRGQSTESSGNHDNRGADDRTPDDRRPDLNYMTAASFQSSDDDGDDDGEQLEVGGMRESPWGGMHRRPPLPHCDAPSPQRGTLGSRSSAPRSIDDPRTSGVSHRMGSRGVSIESLLSESSLVAIDYTGSQPVRLQGVSAGFASDNETCV